MTNLPTEPSRQDAAADDLSEEDVQPIRDGIAEADAGMGQPLAEFDAAFRERNGFAATL